MSIRVPPAASCCLVFLAALGLLYFKLNGLSEPERAAAVPHIGHAAPAGIQWAPAGTRHLSELQVKMVEDRLKPFASQKFWIIAETGEITRDAEEARFGEELRDAVVRAGWIASEKVRQRMGASGFQETMMYSYSRGGDRGLVIFAAPDSMPAGTALNRAISQMPLGSSVERDDNLQNAILIFVGAP